MIWITWRTTFEQIKLILSKESDLEVKFECCRHDKLAQSIFKAAEYALVITEICSTDIDGYELIRHIKSISHTPIVALSKVNKWDESSITQIIQNC